MPPLARGEIKSCGCVRREDLPPWAIYIRASNHNGNAAVHDGWVNFSIGYGKKGADRCGTKRISTAYNVVEKRFPENSKGLNSLRKIFDQTEFEILEKEIIKIAMQQVTRW
jgi:hypothetical protein